MINNWAVRNKARREFLSQRANAGIRGIEWEMTLEELLKDYYLFENTRVLVSGQLSLEENVLYLNDGDACLRTNANPNDWTLGIELQIYGWLRFDNEDLFYYLDMSEP